MPFLFENLEVYKKAIAIADELSTLTESFPKGNYFPVDKSTCYVAKGMRISD